MSPDSPAESPDAANQGVPKQGDVVGGKYLILDCIGEGGMGAVFEGRNTSTLQPVAVKWLLPERTGRQYAERMLREARLTGAVNHPNVVRVVDAGVSERGVFFVMELLEGPTLERWIAQAPLPPVQAVDLLMPVLRGVSAAHRVGVVHRDLKPSNIVLAATLDRGEELRPTVIDFGISRGVRDVEGDQTVTQAGVIVGTPFYMAPEQLAGDVDPDPRCDVYALALILFELLSGGSPFEARAPGLLVAEKLSADPISVRRYVPALSRGLARVVMRGLARDPAVRWESVEAFGEALSAFASEPFETGSPYLASTVADERRPAGRRYLERRPRWSAAAVGVALLGVLVGFVVVALWIMTHPTPLPSPSPERDAVGTREEALSEPSSPVTEAEVPEPSEPTGTASDEMEPPQEPPVQAEPTAEEPADRPVAPRGRRVSRGRTGGLRVNEF